MSVTDIELDKETQKRVRYMKALRAVMILHQDYHYQNGELKTVSRCCHCKTIWPCETMRVIHEEIDNV